MPYLTYPVDVTVTHSQVSDTEINDFTYNTLRLVLDYINKELIPEFRKINDGTLRIGNNDCSSIFAAYAKQYARQYLNVDLSIEFVTYRDELYVKSASAVPIASEPYIRPYLNVNDEI